MDQNHFTTDTLRKKGAHLTFEERIRGKMILIHSDSPLWLCFLCNYILPQGFAMDF